MCYGDSKTQQTDMDGRNTLTFIYKIPLYILYVTILQNFMYSVLGEVRKLLLGMDRKESIKFKLMPDGAIRARDSRYGCGVSEWHIITPPIYATR